MGVCFFLSFLKFNKDIPQMDKDSELGVCFFFILLEIQPCPRFTENGEHKNFSAFSANAEIVLAFIELISNS